MKEILEKYSTRLVNVSGRNRSFVMKKLYKKRAFDLTRLDEFTEDISEKIIKLLLSRGKEELNISKDPYDWYKENLKELKKEHNKNKEIAIKKLKNSDDFTEEKLKELNEKMEQKFEEADEKLKRKQEKLMRYSNSIKSTEKETGRYELYIGYPFVEGYFKDKTFIKAPLFLFPVEAIKKGDIWALKNKIDENVILNKVFLIGYAKFNEEKLADIDTEYSDLSVFGDNFIEGAVKKLKKFNINISFNEPDITMFREITKDTTLNYKLGELTIKNNIIAGQFNIANSIYNDYKEMENINLSNPLINKLLKNIDVDKEAIIDIDKDNEIKGKDIQEKEFFFISDLDYSQEIAVKRSQENSQLVIYGPPGTGKSQTIVNIVSQYLSNSKKVLMVSQKKAALDVIFNRSSSINSKMIMFNKEVDKKQFYASIAARIDSLQKNEVQINEIKSLSQDIDQKLNKLNVLGNVLTKENDFGLSLQEMYSKSKVNIEKDSKLDIFFRDFRREYPFEKFKYKDLVDISKNLLLNEKAEKFYRLKQIMSNNKYSLYLRDNIDVYDLEDAKNDITKLINNYEIILNELFKNSKYNKISKEIALGNK
uniref:AAA domain-containing protein n=1 Tax=Clostridium cuniculi TaxID=2548455 RepID=UPI0018AC5253